MDELHMIDDESRGYILELMATKLLSLEQEVQIIGEFSQEDVLGTCPPTKLGPLGLHHHFHSSYASLGI
jgi:hypothetical protein